MGRPILALWATILGIALVRVIFFVFPQSVGPGTSGTLAVGQVRRRFEIDPYSPENLFIGSIMQGNISVRGQG